MNAGKILPRKRKKVKLGMSGKTTLKPKNGKNDSEKDEIPYIINKQPDVMYWYSSHPSRENTYSCLEVETEASYERSHVTPLGEGGICLLGYLIKDELSRYDFLDFASLPDARIR